MEHCELTSLDSSSFAHNDLGLTLFPGSQPQLSAPWSHEDMDDMDSLFGIGDDFDPFTDFDQLAHRIDGSNKRTSDEAFAGDVKSPASKRQNHEAEAPSVATAPSPGMNPISLRSTPSIPSIPSYSPLPAAGDFVSASSAIKDKFAVGKEGITHHAALEAFAQGQAQSSPKHISPYARVGYYPSAPNLHCRVGGEVVSNEVLQNRLHSSRRRIDVLVAERNKYRDALLRYECVDQKTGKLGIHLLEAEMATLRRVCSTQQQRAKQYKADIEDWRQKYVNVATTHNCLIRDYQQLQAANPGLQPAVEVPRRQQQDEWQGRYEQLSQAFNALYAAYVRKPTDVKATNSLYPSPASPLSISSPTSTSTVPAPASVRSAGSDTCSPTGPHEDLSTDLLTPPSAHPPSGELAQMAANYSFSGRHGYAPPIITPEYAAYLLSCAGIRVEAAGTTANMPGTCPIAPFPAAAAVPAAAASAPTAFPNEVVVIDLTDDADAEVSSQGSNPQPPTSLTPSSSPLAEFHRRFRKKELSWLHESYNPQKDGEIAEHLYQKLNSRKRKRERGEKFVETTVGECYNHVQAQKVHSSYPTILP
ncbi:uncharacterized protein N7482_007495 [Penicillium canariense]|uniref:Uncharacterized protein n=1 Tax=Penicillium canariense TaxID=189055 RepID=A0A9W9HZJ4_9EURO|nr:uncharacterized protein N7482_007495 [Penicillium canariense]KAJ5160491.1 hypothetical protein N7482_007495 [Penicillium canariense]